VEFTNAESCIEAMQQVQSWGPPPNARAVSMPKRGLQNNRQLSQPQLRRPSPLINQLSLPDSYREARRVMNISNSKAQSPAAAKNQAAHGLGDGVAQEDRTSSSAVAEAGEVLKEETRVERQIPGLSDVRRSASRVTLPHVGAGPNGISQALRSPAGVDMAQFSQDMNAAWSFCARDWEEQIEACYKATRDIEDAAQRVNVSTAYGRAIEARHNRIWESVLQRHGLE
jgi:hypothetical protein